MERIARRTEEVCSLLQKVTARLIDDCGVEWIQGSGSLTSEGLVDVEPKAGLHCSKPPRW